MMEPPIDTSSRATGGSGINFNTSHQQVKQLNELTPDQLRLIEENRQKAQERKRQREEAMGNSNTDNQFDQNVSSSDGSKQAKKFQTEEISHVKVANQMREDMGLNFRIEYGGDEDEIELQEDDLEDAMDDVLVNSQFNRPMKDDDENEYYNYD